MKYEEAIISCQMVCEDCKKTSIMVCADFKKTHIYAECIKERCVNYANIKALEKQIPKKPIKANRAVVINGIPTMLDENEFMKCPSCRYKDVILKYGQKYCHHCGQAIDWSDGK